jgi:acyl CoA:acetate/3-ketoacid CoA transferase
MARYLSQHTIACLTRQGAQELTARLHAATAVTARRVLLCLQDGKMLVEFEAGNREELEKFLAQEKFHFDWILRVEYESEGGRLAPV